MTRKTHTISRLVKFPMLGERRPERFWLGASLPNSNSQRNNVKIRRLIAVKKDQKVNS